MRISDPFSRKFAKNFQPDIQVVYDFFSEAGLRKLIGKQSLREIIGKSDVGPVLEASSQGKRMDSPIDTGLAERLLDWRSRVSLTEGLRRTVAWYRGGVSCYRKR